MLSASDKFLQIRNPTGFQTHSHWIRIQLSFWKAFFDDSSQSADGRFIRRAVFTTFCFNFVSSSVFVKPGLFYMVVSSWVVSRERTLGIIGMFVTGPANVTDH